VFVGYPMEIGDGMSAEYRTLLRHSVNNDTAALSDDDDDDETVMDMVEGDRRVVGPPGFHTHEFGD